MTETSTDPYSGEKEKARQALRTVIDPELGINVADLGLIYDISLPGDGTLKVLMTLSTRHCPMGEAIVNGVRNALEAAFPGKEVRVDLTFDPAWSLEMLTEEGKNQLRI